MVKENLIPIQKPFETVYEIKVENEIKKSPLSPAARNKVVNKSGSNFQSEKEGYGACEYSGCSYPSNVRFYVIIAFNEFVNDTPSGFKFWNVEMNPSLSYPATWFVLRLEDVGMAHEHLRKFENGEYHVVYNEDYSSNIARRKQAQVMNMIKKYIDCHERGNSVYEPWMNIDESCSIL